MIRLLLVSPLPPPVGGIATWSRTVLGMLQDEPSIEVVHLDTAVRWRPPGKPSLTTRIVGGSFQALRDFFRVVNAIRVQQPDLLHLTTSGGPAGLRDWLILSAARWLGVKSVLHYRGELRPGWGFELTLRAAGRADSLVLLDAESEFLVADRCPEIPVIRLPNIFQPPRLEEPDTAKGQGQRQNIVFGGRVTAAKGVPQLIKACREIADLDVHLLGWVDPKLQSLLEESSRRGSETWLHVHGAVEYEVFLERLRLADLLVLPSLSEGFPNVVLEAMASGTAVVATRVGAVEEVLGVEGDHPGGVCCPPNDIGALRNAIETLLNDPGRRRQMGDNGRERVRDFYGKEALIKLTQHWKALVSTPEVSLSDASLEPRSASRSRPT